MEEEALRIPEVEPSPNSKIWAGLGLIAVGGLTDLTVTMFEMSRQAYINAANLAMMGQTKLGPAEFMPTSRNIFAGGLVTAMAGIVLYFKGIKNQVEQTAQLLNPTDD